MARLSCASRCAICAACRSTSDSSLATREVRRGIMSSVALTSKIIRGVRRGIKPWALLIGSTSLAPTLREGRSSNAPRSAAERWRLRRAHASRCHEPSVASRARVEHNGRERGTNVGSLALLHARAPLVRRFCVGLCGGGGPAGRACGAPRAMAPRASHGGRSRGREADATARIGDSTAHIPRLTFHSATRPGGQQLVDVCNKRSCL